MTNNEVISRLSKLRSLMISAIKDDIIYIGFDEDDIEAIEMAVSALVGRPFKFEITEIHQFVKPDEVEGLNFPNSEVWNGHKGQSIQPQGTFDKIFNDPDEDQEDKF